MSARAAAQLELKGFTEVYQYARGKADWIELLMWAVFVTAGLRWALLNQEQRCQRCLRMLSQPTRVGIPSRNFLEWSGTELRGCERIDSK